MSGQVPLRACRTGGGDGEFPARSVFFTCGQEPCRIADSKKMRIFAIYCEKPVMK